MNINVEIKGAEELKDAFDKAPAQVINETSKAIQKSILQIQNDAMKEAPVNKQTGGGTLRQNIKSRMMTKLSGVIEALAPYSVFVHEGTAPHIIRAKIKKGLANARTGQFFGKVVHHPGTKPNPFFTRAIKNSGPKIETFFATALKNVLKIFPK
jgi:HK97 gp10 family phage protein